MYDQISRGTVTQADAIARFRAWRPSTFPAACGHATSDGGL
jgi:hypothetical protein